MTFNLFVGNGLLSRDVSCLLIRRPLKVMVLSDSTTVTTSKDNRSNMPQAPLQIFHVLNEK
jgi:hypothetical protein